MNRLNRDEAERLFNEADKLYREQQFAESLAILDRLDVLFPNRHRVLFPRARCLAKLGQFQEALTVCQALVHEHEYDKAKPLLDMLVQHQAAPSTVQLEPYLASGFETPPPTDGRAFDSKIDLKKPPPIGISAVERKAPKPRIRLKPVRMILLVLVGIAVWRNWIVWWLGVAIVVAYFVLKFAVSRLVMRLFETPFRIKGAVLRNATANVHAVRRRGPPDRPPGDDAEGSREWFEIDVTIVPAAHDGPFQLWEPGELALAPAGFAINTADDIDGTIQVADCRFVESHAKTDGSEDAPDKIHGATRLMLTVGVPPGMQRAQFAYYFETFGDVQLS